MPYASYSEKPGVGGKHLLSSELLSDFVSECSYIRMPDEDRARQIASLYRDAPHNDSPLPSTMLGVDGSRAVVALNQRLPTSQIAFVTVSIVKMDLARYRELSERSVLDPRDVNACFSSHTLTCALPGPNVRYKGAATVSEGFRLALHETFQSENTRLTPNGPVLRETLWRVMRQHPDIDPDRRVITVDRCPSCGQDKDPIEVPIQEGWTSCSLCDAPVFDTDTFRLDADVEIESQAGRVMSTIERLLPAHWIASEQAERRDWTDAGFMIDGPLALFQRPQALTRALQAFHYECDSFLTHHGRPKLLAIGLQKTGALAEHLSALRPYISDESYVLVDEVYRYDHVRQYRPEGPLKPFGEQEYYGQDFLYASESGGRFVVSLPYPTRTRDTKPDGAFQTTKNDPANYQQLARAFSVVKALKDSRGADAITLIGKAHEAASISSSDVDRLARYAASSVEKGVA